MSDAKGWRARLKIHPACELFPTPTADELDALAVDIKTRGVQTPIVFWYPGERHEKPTLETCALLDGRSRLDAMELAGLPVMAPLAEEPEVFDLQLPEDKVQFVFASDGIDPWQFVLSANLLRRHLTRDQKHEVIEKLLRQTPRMVRPGDCEIGAGEPDDGRYNACRC